MYVKRRGVSEILSTVILILIVSVAGSFLFAYSTNLFQTQQQNILQRNELTSGRSQERFRVTSIWWNGNDNLLNVTLYNYGSTDISISDIYVNGEPCVEYFFGRNTALYTGKLLRVGFTSPTLIVSGQHYSITVVTSRGVSKIEEWDAI